MLSIELDASSTVSQQMTTSPKWSKRVEARRNTTVVWLGGEQRVWIVSAFIRKSMQPRLWRTIFIVFLCITKPENL